MIIIDVVKFIIIDVIMIIFDVVKFKIKSYLGFRQHMWMWCRRPQKLRRQRPSSRSFGGGTSLPPRTWTYVITGDDLKVFNARESKSVHEPVPQIHLKVHWRGRRRRRSERISHAGWLQVVTIGHHPSLVVVEEHAVGPLHRRLVHLGQLQFNSNGIFCVEIKFDLMQ